jgi:hypothetical protein
MKKLIILAIVLFTQIDFAQQRMPLGTAINKAARQRMLVMKMTKNYMALGANVRSEDAGAELDDATSLFNESLRDLTANFVKDTDISSAFTEVNTLWSNFRTVIATTPDLTQASVIVKQSSNLLNACNTALEKIQKLNEQKNPNAKVVSSAGIQRMYLQKLAMLCIAKEWGVDSNLDNEIRNVIATFESNMNLLQSRKDITSPDIESGLAFQKSEWDFLKKSLNPDMMRPANIYSSTNLMTKEFDVITSQYEKIVNEMN